MTDDFFAVPEQCAIGRVCDTHGKYYLPSPYTGEADHYDRVSTLKAMPEDTYHIHQWKRRNVAKGLASSPGLLAQAQGSTVPRTLDTICDVAEDLAGANVASTLGTEVHDYTELADRGRVLDVPEQWHTRMADYHTALDDHGITVLPDMIERAVVSTVYGVAGRFDRVVRLADGTHAVLDLKTGKSLYKEFAIQAYIYAEAFNSHGVWDDDAKAWMDPGFKVREDFAIIVHLPARGKGARVLPIDLETGRLGANLAQQIQGWRQMRVEGWHLPLDVIPFRGEDTMSVIATASSREDLVAIMRSLESVNAWSKIYADACRARLAEIQ